jgi:cyclopropane-fatty-acyl-phospholipid synthase
MAHYDLGNDFYRLWLDPGMSYSSALFTGPRRRTLDRLRRTPSTGASSPPAGRGGTARAGDRLRLGRLCRNGDRDGLAVTGLTLSPAQLEWAQQRVPQADLRLQDYRDTQEQFDHVVSIEMFEAVGERWWPTYFRTVAMPSSRAAGGDPEHHHP